MDRTFLMRTALVALIAVSTAGAQIVISNETLVAGGTTFVVSKVPVTVGCDNICSDQKPLTAPVSINCPDATCTVHIALDSQVTGSGGGETFIKFLVDDAAPTPGPTSPSGLYPFWANATGLDGSPQASIPASVVASVGSGAHTLALGLNCTSPNDFGCGATVSTTTVRIDVFTP